MLPRNEYSEGNHQCSTMPVESVTSQKRPGLTGRGASAAGIVCVYPPKSGDDGVIPREPFTQGPLHEMRYTVDVWLCASVPALSSVRPKKSMRARIPVSQPRDACIDTPHLCWSMLALPHWLLRSCCAANMGTPYDRRYCRPRDPRPLRLCASYFFEFETASSPRTVSRKEVSISACSALTCGARGGTTVARSA